MARHAFSADGFRWVDDDELLRAIVNRIDNDPAFWVGHRKRGTMIVVEVDDGVVTLNGCVRTASERRRADILARALGAEGVDNRLRLEQEIGGKPD